MTHDQGLCYDFLAFLGKIDRLKLPVDEAAKIVKDFFADPTYSPKLNQNSAQSFKQFDFALDRMSETIRSTNVLLGEVVDLTADRFDRIFGDFADAIADLKEKSGVKD